MSLRDSRSDCVTPNTNCNVLKKCFCTQLEVHLKFAKSVRQVRHDKEIKSLVCVNLSSECPPNNRGPIVDTWR